jgi:hypothetical protein
MCLKKIKVIAMAATNCTSKMWEPMRQSPKIPAPRLLENCHCWQWCQCHEDFHLITHVPCEHWWSQFQWSTICPMNRTSAVDPWSLANCYKLHCLHSTTYLELRLPNTVYSNTKFGIIWTSTVTIWHEQNALGTCFSEYDSRNRQVSNG